MKNILNLLAVCAISLLSFSTVHATSTNLAPNGTATQSSSHGADASRANDGNTDGNYWNGSVTHTNSELGWWQVDLKSEFDLDSIMLWNRTDYRPNRLTNFRVSALNSGMDEVWGEDYFPYGGYFNPSMYIQLPDSTVAQFVKIQLYNTNWLSLAEVQVFGSSVAPEPLSSILFISGGVVVGLRYLRKNN